jgi:hypothetical protein
VWEHGATNSAWNGAIAYRQMQQSSIALLLSPSIVKPVLVMAVSNTETLFGGVVKLRSD